MQIQLSDKLERERIELLARRDAFVKQVAKKDRPTEFDRRTFASLRAAVNKYIRELIKSL